MEKMISKNAQQISKDGIYCCFIGTKHDGHDYLDIALNNGAKTIYGTKDIIGIDNYIKVDDINKTYINLCQDIYQYHHIKDKIKIIGITGTDGKTSSALLLKDLISKTTNCAYIGTSGFIINDQVIENIGLTTPFAEDLYRYFYYAYQQKCQYIVMEISSHSLVQQRFGDKNQFYLNGVIITNLTHEHLDYHHDINNYLQAKLQILNYIDDQSSVVINADDPYFYKTSLHDKYISYSLLASKANYQITNIDNTLDGSLFYINNFKIQTNLIGLFNVYNLTGVLLLLHLLGFNNKKHLSYLQQLSIKGRMETYTLNDNKIIIDFAHTPDSIKKVLALLKSQTPGKLIVVNGCAGERDQSKRPIIGQIMEQYCDTIILTEDDPRSEKVSDINKMIMKDIKAYDKVVMIEKRIDAIKYGFDLLTHNDTLVLLGKGGQEYQCFATGKEPYEEQQVVAKLIKEYHG